ncbi:hypothetical protein B0H13DRAFT_2342921 [Mycena leptocephala]|nr:hypothetical protein B0H13DRAFT_2342921 [Mycena leptocephala]
MTRYAPRLTESPLFYSSLFFSSTPAALKTRTTREAQRRASLGRARRSLSAGVSCMLARFAPRSNPRASFSCPPAPTQADACAITEPNRAQTQQPDVGGAGALATSLARVSRAQGTASPAYAPVSEYAGGRGDESADLLPPWRAMLHRRRSHARPRSEPARLVHW